MFGSSLTVTEAMLADSVLWYSEAGNLPAVISDIQIELGTEKTEFEPYKGDVFTVSFGKAVISGTYDWTTGKLTDESGNVTSLASQKINSLAGVNILSGGVGGITVTSRTDLKVYIDSLLQPAAAARVAQVKLLASAWVGSGNLYSQVVTIDGVTENSQVNLTPSIQQLSTFYEKDITFSTENAGGVVTVYVIGQKPENDYTIQADIVEVIA